MKRDMELIREILKFVADTDSVTVDPHVFVSDDTPWPLVFYQVKILEQAGYIEAYVSNYKHPPQKAEIIALTWQGEEFLFSIQDDTIWSRTKKTIGKALAAVPFDIIKAVAMKLISGVLAI
jgi:hypothetical protein